MADKAAGKHRQIFTDRMLKGLLPRESKYYLRENDGFAIRVMPSGVKTWLYIYNYDSKRREMVLGQYPDVSLKMARERYGDAKKLLAAGTDPGRADRQEKEERRKAPTVADLCDEYLKKWAKPRKKSWEADERTINANILPVLGKMKARDVTRRDVVLLLEDIAEGAPVLANRVQSLLSKIFNFGIDRMVCEHNPAMRLKLAKEAPKERALSNDEIAVLWSALMGNSELIMSDAMRRALLLILVTGQRPGEVIGLHSREIDGEWWTIPAERSKNGKSHRVYLTETAKALIGETVGYIFPSPDREGKLARSIAVNALSFALRRNISGQSVRRDKTKRRNGEAYKRGPYKSKAAPVNANRLGLDPFTPHDLRRTMATGLARIGVRDETIDAVLNHTKPGIVRVYNVHKYDDEKKAALLAWEEKLLGLTGKARVAA